MGVFNIFDFGYIKPKLKLKIQKGPKALKSEELFYSKIFSKNVNFCLHFEFVIHHFTLVFLTRGSAIFEIGAINQHFSLANRTLTIQ